MAKIISKISFMISAVFILCMVYSGDAQAAVKTMYDGGQFDPSFYAATYDDVYRAFGMNETLLYQHYLLFGIKEKRLPYAGYVYPVSAPGTVLAPGNNAQSTLIIMPDGTMFDPVFYAKQYPDVAAIMGNTPANLYAHYYYYGINEGRKPYAGYQPSDVKLTFSTVGAFVNVSTNDDVIQAVRQAAKYRVSDLTIYGRWNTQSAEQIAAVINGQAAYLKAVYGCSITLSAPKFYGDVQNLTIETGVRLRFV